MEKTSSHRRHNNDSDCNDQRSYRVEKILDVRGRGRSTEYLIKWLGFDNSHNTWEPPAHLVGSQELLEAFRANRIRENIRKYQNKKNGDFTLEDAEMRKDFKSELLKNNGKPSFLVPIPEIEELSIHKDRKEESETELIEELSKDKYNSKKNKLRSKRDEVKDDDNEPKIVKQKVASVSDHNEKKPIRATSHESNKPLVGHQLFNLEKLEDGTKFITSAQISDSDRLKHLKKDLSKAVDVKKHVLINKKLHFLLEWNDKSIEDFYSKHYFSFAEIEEENPKVLLNYMKSFLNGTYI